MSESVGRHTDAALASKADGDSAGLPWSGRSLAGIGFADDTGLADPALSAALSLPDQTLAAVEQAVMRAVSGARLLVPIVAAASEVDQAGRPAVDALADMAVVTIIAPEGQRALPVFSSQAALADWDDGARPVPVSSARAAQAAVAERCDVLLLDLGSEHARLLRPSMVWALAQEREWLPSHEDPFVSAALRRVAGLEPDVVDCEGGAGEPDGSGTLRVVLTLRPGLDRVQVEALVTRFGERLATDGETRARIDGITFALRAGPTPAS